MTENIIRDQFFQLENKLNKMEKKYDEIAVIRDYFGITEKKAPQNVASVNQAIYKQLRGHLDGAMKNYRERVDKGEVKKIV